MLSKIFISNSEFETFSLGEKFGSLIKNLNSGLIVLMYGDLGSGKTVFVRGVGKSLNAHNIHSPSFTLINEHENISGKLLVHADLYRLDQNSVSSIGLDDYTDDFLFIEWAERLNFDLSDNVVKIFFETFNLNSRAIKIISENQNLEFNTLFQNL